MLKTTIQVDSKTLKRLKKKKRYKRETYDEIVNRLIDREGDK
ncbi:MAG: hypothetical protein ABH874_00490 [Methanobacteriota archaeon]